MKQRSSAAARALAVTALVAGFLVPALLIGGALGGGSSGSGGRSPAGRGGGAKPRRAGAYVVRNGDTLSSIARRTGVPVVRIQRLNPGVDPRVLISGEKLKLR